jgi:hypothetical protein
MRFLRLIVAGLIAVAAMVAVLFAAAVVFLTGLMAFVLQLFGVRKNAPPTPAAPATDRQPQVMRDADAIEVETTKVPDKTIEL